MEGTAGLQVAVQASAVACWMSPASGSSGPARAPCSAQPIGQPAGNDLLEGMALGHKYCEGARGGVLSHFDLITSIIALCPSTVTLRYWGLGLQYMKFGEDIIEPIAEKETVVSLTSGS